MILSTGRAFMRGPCKELFFKSQPKNFFSTHSDPSKLAVLILGNSNIGYHIARKGVERGHKVIVTTRSEVEQGKEKPIEYIHTPVKKQFDSSFWRDLVKKHIPNDSHLLVVNTIGGSVAAPNQTIEDLNTHIPLAAVEGVIEEAQSSFRHNYNVVQLSTSAAGELEAPYGKTKRETERLLKELPIPNLTIFRMSYVAEALFKDTVTQTYKDQHRLSAEEFALLPFTPLIGNPWDYKRVILQPVAMEDVATAAYNTVNLPRGNRVIDAVSDEEMTQEEFFKFYTDLIGKKFRPLFIPVEAADIMATHHPFGHCISYAVEFCAEDRSGHSHEAFEKLVGKPLKTLSEVYQTKSDKKFTLTIPRPPLVAFGSQVFQNIWRNPRSLIPIARATGIMGQSMLWNKEKPVLSLSETSTQTAKYDWVSMSEEDFNQHSETNRICGP
jgi:nucleoside-diphosphate-sugar epimerase